MTTIQIECELTQKEIDEVITLSSKMLYKGNMLGDEFKTESGKFIDIQFKIGSLGIEVDNITCYDCSSDFANETTEFALKYLLNTQILPYYNAYEEQRNKYDQDAQIRADQLSEIGIY